MKVPARALRGPYTLRPVAEDDGAALLRYRVENRDAFRPFEPRQAPGFYTAAHVAAWIEAALQDAGRDRRYCFVMVEDGTDCLAGHVNLNNVVRGAFQSCHIGYASDHRLWGRGLMTAAVGAAVEIAFADLDLHRAEAAILPDNLASIRVVIKNGFSEEGYARFYLAIDGAWRDHRIFARTNPERTVP